jgi:hypothetical protein
LLIIIGTPYPQISFRYLMLPPEKLMPIDLE